MARAEETKQAQQGKGLGAAPEAAAVDLDAPPLTRADLVLWRQAARPGWAVPEAYRLDVLVRLGRLLRSPSDRVALAAAKTLALFDRADLEARKLRLDRVRLDRMVPTPSGAEALDPGAAEAALRAASAYLEAQEAPEDGPR